MQVTNTEFRKNLFQIVDRALQGELIEVAHKGRLVRLVPGGVPTKMARLISRDTIRGTVADLEQLEVDDEMRTAWEEKRSPQP